MASKPILLTVDDDPEVLRAIERDLRHQYGKDYRVLRADAGATALAALRQVDERGEPVALLLVDQRMPQMSGVEFLEQARAVFPDAKRVLLTAYADTEAAIRAINTVKVDYYSMKPWDPPEENLYPVLDDLLGDWQANYRPPFEGIRVIGHRWSADSHALKDFLGRIVLGLQATRPSRLLRIPSAAVQHMLTSGYPIASHLITGIYEGVQTLMMQTRQQEKMAALGKLSAGLAHELNNPAAAARRAAAALRRALSDGRDAALMLATAGRLPDEAAALTHGLKGLEDELAERANAAEQLDPLARSDRADTVAAWLDDHGVPDSYDVAGTLVDAGLDPAWLEGVAQRVPPQALRAVVCTITVTATARTLVDQVERGTARISELVAAVKSYSYMDQAPLQDVDLHEGLESTLTLLGHKLRAGITITRAYDRSLPRIGAYGSELNQVWTNLIDNAIAAMSGQGELRVVTRRDGDDAVVEIGDTGHGIPSEIQPRIFEPLFTTKDVGQGSGLGLDIAYRIIVAHHHGDIVVQSEPGNTRVRVRIPLEARG